MLSIARWLKTWMPTLWGSGGSCPRFGGLIPQSGESRRTGSAYPPQCGDVSAQRAAELPIRSAGRSTTHAPHCGDSPVERAVETLQALQKVWMQAADVPHGGPLRPWRRSPQDLALLFLRRLQAHPRLIGMAIHRRWIQECYENFCEVEGVTWPPPYKDFARELARLMMRKRIEEWRNGQRLGTATYYFVPDSAVEGVSRSPSSIALGGNQHFFASSTPR